MGYGIIILPIILPTLSAEEIGINYLMLTISSFVSLFDFGFSPQFARNITYVFSGVNKLQKEGVGSFIKKDCIDFQMVIRLIETAKYVYKIISTLILIILLTAGTCYIFYVTNKFSKIDNILYIWLIFCLSVYFNMYFLYYNSLLIGRGLIKESQKALVFSKLLNILLTILLVCSGYGLVGLVLANLISPFLGRYISHHYFYDDHMLLNIKGVKVCKDEIKETFYTLWYNAKRMGLVSIGAYGVSQAGLLLSGTYLSLVDVGSYGLMTQFVGAITAVSGTIVSVYSPLYASLRVENNNQALIKRFAFAINIFYLLFALGVLVLVFFVPHLLLLIHSNASLPAKEIVIIYCFIRFLETNHSNFALLILSGNKVPFTKASLISGGVIVLGTLCVIMFTDWGILGLIIVPGIVQLCYQNWKWPRVACEELNITYIKMLIIGFKETKNRLQWMFR